MICLQLLSQLMATGLRAAEGESQLPQLDPDTFEPQLIWLFISFLVLYLVMSRTALPKVGAILEERANRKADDLDQADRARKESEGLEAAYQDILAAARAGSTKILREARQDLNADLDNRKAEMTAKLAGRLDEAEATIKTAKEKAMKDLEGIATETCQAVVEKLSGHAANKKNSAAAVRDEIKALT
jgi:F-type H+-transporting ATPase subunit b